MNKLKLIEYLNSIEGNPDIVMWNDFVEDYHHISLSKHKLYKATLKDEYAVLTLEKRVTLERELTFKERCSLYKLAKKHFKETEYELGRNFLREHLKPKPVIVIQGLERGKSTFDRLGTIHY